jgi:hypothetical protein
MIGIVDGLGDKHERLVLFVVVVVKVPELLLSLPPPDDTTKAGKLQEALEHNGSFRASRDAH